MVNDTAIQTIIKTLVVAWLHAGPQTNRFVYTLIKYKYMKLLQNNNASK